MKIINSKAIPKTGGALLVGNHSSWFDTLFLSSVIFKPLWFVTGEFIFNVPVMGNLVRHLFVIPIARNNSRESIEKAVKKIKDGNLVCIFPEGELTKTGKLHRFRNGVAIIHKLSNAPIVPFYLDGAINTWSLKQKIPLFFKKVTLRFGDKFIPSAQKDSEIANEIKSKVEELV